MGFGGWEVARGGDGGRVCMGWSRGWMGIGKAGGGWVLVRRGKDGDLSVWLGWV